MPAVQMPVSHLFEPQHLAGTFSSAYHTHARTRAHMHTHTLSLSRTQTGSTSDTSSFRQLWDWAQKWGLSLTANHFVCLPSSQGLSRSLTCYIVPPPANPNPLFFHMEYLLWPILKPSPALCSVSSGQIGSILLKALHSPGSASVTFRKTVGGDVIVPQSQS